MTELWYCDPRDPVRRRCYQVPCPGHRPTLDHQLVAKTIARVEGVDWFGLPQSARRGLLARAYQIHQDIIHGDFPEEPA